MGFKIQEYLMRLRENWISFYTLFRREMVRIIRIWQQTLLPPVITMSLYFVIFGDLIGPRIGTMGGFDYIQYIMPGLVMMAIINNAYLNVTSSVFGNKFQRNFEELLVAPMSYANIILGYVCAGIARGLLVGVAVIFVSLFFTKISVNDWIATIVIALLSSALFSIAGMINGLLAKKFDDISIVPVFILTPLTYLGGVFYSVDMLSPFWRSLTHLNPIFYIINAFRYALLGYSDVDLVPSLFIIFVATIVLFWVCHWLLKKGIGVKS